MLTVAKFSDASPSFFYDDIPVSDGNSVAETNQIIAWDCNLYHPPHELIFTISAHTDLTYVGLGAWNLGTGMDPHSLLADPRFASDGALIDKPRDVMIRADSPAMDSAA